MQRLGIGAYLSVAALTAAAVLGDHYQTSHHPFWLDATLVPELAPVTSFPYKGHQIRMLRMPEETFFIANPPIDAAALPVHSFGSDPHFRLKEIGIASLLSPRPEQYLAAQKAFEGIIGRRAESLPDLPLADLFPEENEKGKRFLTSRS